MKHRACAVLLLAIALPTALGWVGDSWGETKIARVGILATAPSEAADDVIAEFYEPFRAILAQHGWIEGKNVSLEIRNAGGNPPQFADAVGERPTKFRFIVNLKTAKALGLNIPQSIILQADEVIR